jgi:hypothetical protein
MKMQYGYNKYYTVQFLEREVRHRHVLTLEKITFSTRSVYVALFHSDRECTHIATLVYSFIVSKSSKIFIKEFQNQALLSVRASATRLSNPNVCFLLH